MKNILYLSLILMLLSSCSEKSSTTTGTTTAPSANIACTISNSLSNGVISLLGVNTVKGSLPDCRINTCLSNYTKSNDERTCIYNTTNNNLAPTNMYYTVNPLTLYVDQLILTSYTPSVTNCTTSTPCSFALTSGILPVGLSINPSTGAITGTPTIAKTLTSYTIRATNSYGSTTTTLSLKTIYRPPSGLSILNSNAIYAVGTQISNNIISYSSGTGTVQSMSVSPTLPSGLSLSLIGTQSWAITGIPTQSSPNTTYTLTATGPDGATASISFNIEVSTAPTSISFANTAECQNTVSGYYECNFTFGQPISNIVPSFNGSNVLFRIASSGSSPTTTLPSGISLSTSTGQITTSYLGPFESTETLCGINSYCIYNIEVYNSLGSAFKLIKIKVNPAPPPTSFNYSLSQYTYRVLTPISNNDPTFPTGLPQCYQQSNCFSVNPALPSGLTLSPATGRIAGTPSKTAIQPFTTYTVSANDSRVAGGKIYSQPFQIEIKERIPVFKYGANGSYSLKKNVNIESTGSLPKIDTSLGIDTPSCGPNAIPINSFSISPSLPNGLSLNTGAFSCGEIYTGGTITGTPTSFSPQTEYTITGCNDGGCSTSVISIDISPYTTKIIAGENHACALVEESGSIPNQLMCWGKNDYNQIQSSTDICNGISCNKVAKYIKMNNVPVSNIITVSAGKNHTCFISKINNSTDSSPANGNVTCFGDNTYGQLGIGSSVNNNALLLNTVIKDDNTELTNVSNISSGGDDTCAIATTSDGVNGAVYCWGKNYGNKAIRIGNNTNDPLNMFAAISLTVGENHACAIRLVYGYDNINLEYTIESYDTTYCWGKNNYGQLGSGNSLSAVFNYSPVQVIQDNNNPINNINSLISGSNHTCAYSASVNNSLVYCWGNNEYGQVKGSSVYGSLFSKAQTVVDFTGSGILNSAFKMGSSANTTSIQLINNEYGFFGKIFELTSSYNNLTQTIQPTYFLMDYTGNGDISNFSSGSSLSIGSSANDFMCDVLATKENVYCWGKNNYGQLGNNNTTNQALPTKLIFNFN